MLRSVKKILDNYYMLTDDFESSMNDLSLADFPEYGRNFLTRDIARANFGSFLFYLAGTDGSITLEECKFIKTILAWDLTPQELSNLIAERGLHKPTFFQYAPPILKYAMKVDKLLNKQNGTTDPSFSMYTISVFDMLGKLMVIADSEATETEYNAYDNYIKMLIKYVENNFNGNGVCEIQNFLSAEFNIHGGGDGLQSHSTKQEKPSYQKAAKQSSTQKSISRSTNVEEEDYDILEDTSLWDSLDYDATSEKSETKEESIPLTTGIGKSSSETPKYPSYKKQSQNTKEYPTDNSNKEKTSNKASEDDNLEELLGELNSLIGLEKVKDDVRSLINLVRIMKLREKNGMKKIPVSLHLVFSGNPGTGKTTVARLLAKIYKNIGVLSTGQLVEVDRAGLVGGYVGHTAPKTKEVIEKAMGGILFIDEAYTLTNNPAKEDYGQEAVDTILKAMEDNRDSFVVIVAGYPKLMEEFVNSNPGLKSRFNKFFTFDDYTPEELKDIFAKLCKDNQYKASKEAMDYVYEYFTKKYQNRNENFANGREVRNFFEKAIAKQANRLAENMHVTQAQLVALTLEDVTGI